MNSTSVYFLINTHKGKRYNRVFFPFSYKRKAQSKNSVKKFHQVKTNNILAPYISSPVMHPKPLNIPLVKDKVSNKNAGGFFQF